MAARGLRFARQPTGVGAAVAGAPAGAKACAPSWPARAARRAALKPYRKFSHESADTVWQTRRQTRQGADEPSLSIYRNQCRYYCRHVRGPETHETTSA